MSKNSPADSHENSSLSAQQVECLHEILGYLNFSNGKPDSRFQRNLNQLMGSLSACTTLGQLRSILEAGLNELQKTAPAFADISQGEAIIHLVVDCVLPGYRNFHSDLLFHLQDEDFEQPFFLARMFEAVLAQGPPWTEEERISEGAIARMNDFIGVRPVAVLENERLMEPYAHEWFCLPPIYIRDAGVAVGRYHDLIERTLKFFQDVPREIQQEAYFDLSRLEELALDVRAYDHLHPVNKRTNYMFGEWDPHAINIKGEYTRFVVRKNILDSLLSWMDSYTNVPQDERLHDAAAVLCGTMLMASSISGSGPATHDSSTSLTSLLPHVAMQRDLFYSYLLDQATGERAKRLKREAEIHQQPFGHVRKHLNIELAAMGAHQLHCRFLAQLFARMGSPDASREQAARIPSPAARIESEIGWRLTSAALHLDQNQLEPACKLLGELEDLLDRGIQCGAIVDPWNILAFQGQFPLFHTREDVIPDQRIELLLDFMERLFDVYSRAMSESAARGETEQTERLSQAFQKRADWWDQFATTVVEDLPKVQGMETWNSACAVAEALKQWRRAGESAGDISFWREHVDEFHSPSAYGQVVNTLLDKGDHVAAMGLLMQWLSQAGDVGLEAGEYSFNTLIIRWTRVVTEGTGLSRLDSRNSWLALRRLFDYLEANADEFWSVPRFDSEENGRFLEEPGEEDLFEHGEFEESDSGEDWDEDDEDEESSLYGAAYEGVVFRDSAEDGTESDTLDEGYRTHNSEIESMLREQEIHLSFLATLAELWEIAARHFLNMPEEQTLDLEPQQSLINWLDQVRTLERGLIRLLTQVSDYDIPAPAGDFDSNYEYDMQMQARNTLQHRIVETTILCRRAGWWLQACLPDDMPDKKPQNVRQRLARLLGYVFRRDVVRLRETLPEFLKWLGKQPLLYVPLENDGDPKRFLAIKTMQTVLRLLLEKLAKIGLLEEVEQLLQTAHRMERNHRPEGIVTTEFDQLFKIALKGVLECVVRSISARPKTVSHIGLPVQSRRTNDRSFRRKRRSRRANQNLVKHFRRQHVPQIRTSLLSARTTKPISGLSVSPTKKRSERTAEIVAIAERIVARYQKLWISYSHSIRISVVEVLRREELWEQTSNFIQQFGDYFFQTPMLMVSNLRSILHIGVDSYLDYLEEEGDPLNPNPLLEAIHSGDIERETACRLLELVYECVLEKLDRFIEYNTTTTQSDYGSQLYCLLDFLRTEVAYDRDSWLLRPWKFAHEVLTETSQVDVAMKWEQVLQKRSQKKAEKHCRSLRKLEKQHGVRLPSLADRLGERFVKSLSVNRMLALVPKSLAELREFSARTEAFDQLRAEIQRYLDSSSGSAIEVPDWMIRLDREIQRFDVHSSLALHESVSTFGEPAPLILRPRQLARRLKRK
ncbi:MAG: hypothetical protein Tsb009_24590 [Planctomycetaceae bacterium]